MLVPVRSPVQQTSAYTEDTAPMREEHVAGDVANQVLKSDAPPARGRDVVHVKARMYDDLHECRHLRALPHGHRHMDCLPNTCM